MPDRDPIPVACTLDAGGVERRAQDWRGVAAGALRARMAVPNGVRLEFRPDHATTHQLLDLVSAERDCCGWAFWTLTSSADATIVEVTAADSTTDRSAAVATIRRMFEVPG